MSSDLVNVKPEDVRKLAHALDQFAQQMRDANKQARRAVDAAQWNDRRKDQFLARYSDFGKRLDGFVSGEIRDMVKSLNALAVDLERVRSHRF